MKIKFLSTHRMSEDGHTIKLFEKGQEYDVADTCAKAALHNGWAYNCEPYEDVPIESSSLFDSIVDIAKKHDAKFYPQADYTPHNASTLITLGLDKE